MQLQDIKLGLKVQFITLRNGRRVRGAEGDIFIIKDVNFNDWGACNILVECDGYEVYTNYETIELATDAAIKAWEAEKIKNKKEAEEIPQPQGYKQITIFDLLEVSQC